jgi:hypothetical protein
VNNEAQIASEINPGVNLRIIKVSWQAPWAKARSAYSAWGRRKREIASQFSWGLRFRP